MTDFIQGDRFKTLTRNIYAPPAGQLSDRYRNNINNFCHSDYRYLANTCDRRSLGDYDIIYTHTFFADQLFEYLENIDKKFIVITHNADNCVDIFPPDNVIKWYAQNVNIIHPRIESIPIGIENDRWFKEIHKKEKMVNKIQQPRKYRNLVYMNFNIDTAPGERQPVYELFKDKSWVTTRMGKNGSGFDDYINNIYNHPFVLCPEGNGIDTHRTWESLYLRTIPIEKKNINNQFYTDLPICLVDDWEQITEKFLLETIEAMSKKEWNMDKLSFDYWKRKIVNGK